MIVVDVETGGLNPEKNPLFSIGAVDFDEKRTFYGRMRSRGNMEITEEALGVNGINPKEWDETAETPKKVLEDFILWVAKSKGDLIIAGQNVAFDVGFLKQNFMLEGLEYPFGYRVVDLHSVVYAKFFYSPSISEKKYTSDNIYKLLGIGTEPRPHNALTGAVYTAEAFSRLIHLHPMWENKSYPIGENN